MEREPNTIAIIGGGIAGLTAAYRLLQRGQRVRLFEKEPVLGGLASSFPFEGGHLERYYHFVCMNDQALFAMLGELGLADRLHWRLTKMGQFYEGRLYSFGDPWDVLTFRPLTWKNKLRFGLNILDIKRQPADAWRTIEDQTVGEWMTRRFGRETYEALHKPLVDLKFGPYADRVSAAWMWARIHRLGKSRTPVLQLEKLGHIAGGTQVLVDALRRRIEAAGGTIHTGSPVTRISTEDGRARSVTCAGETLLCDAVLSTVPMPALVRMLDEPGSRRLAGLNTLDSIGVTCLVLRLKQPFSRYFWTNISDRRIDVAGVIEYSNLNRQVCENGDSMVYIPQYLPSTSSRYQLSDAQILEEYLGYLRRMRPDFRPEWMRQSWVFRDQFAQPICTTGFSKQVAHMESPLAGLFITDSHQLYPDDRTVSNSIDLGTQAAERVAGHLTHGDGQ